MGERATFVWELLEYEIDRLRLACASLGPGNLFGVTQIWRGFTMGFLPQFFPMKWEIWSVVQESNWNPTLSATQSGLQRNSVRLALK
jgi:hypothetical protein